MFYRFLMAPSAKKAVSTPSAAPKRTYKKKVPRKAQTTVEPVQSSMEQPAEPIELPDTKKRKAKGSVTMEHLQKRKFTGEKLAIQYNCKGQMHGKANTWLQSFLGGIVQKVPITYTNWVENGSKSAKVVPESTKAKIWEQVEVINYQL